MDKLFAFLKKLFSEKFFGSVTIKMESGKVTHVEVNTKRAYEYHKLPVE